MYLLGRRLAWVAGMVFGELGDLPAEFAQRIVLFFPRTLSYPSGSPKQIHLALQ